jgi:glycosyltransferase involved in cell wall biosynthesis/uncharacterized protein (DUF2062 family)
MTHPPRICAVIPVYNHGLTVRQVVEGAKSFLPVIAVNDGSTDGTATALAQVTGITVVTLRSNQGKAAAIQAGFARAVDLGFTHAVTLDADGQHPTAALPKFIGACQRQPEALIIGVRNLRKEGAPWSRRFSNGLSTFWFKVETGVRLTDTQCGFRVYPLAAVFRLRVRSRRYAWELEVMVQAAWAGVPLVAQPVASDYHAPTSRLSHFRPGRDMAEISLVHSRLGFQTFCLPALLRRVLARGDLRGLPFGERFRIVCRHLFAEHTETPERLALAVGLGLFCGIVPIWGYQMITAAVLAHRFRLNKAIALTASNISIPLIAPFLIAASLVLGHFLHTGSLIEFSSANAVKQLPIYLGEYLLGSMALAVIVGALGAGIAYWVARRAWAKTAARGGPR